jgi:DNA-directed RNA polymerase specialized sigma24 family protein
MTITWLSTKSPVEMLDRPIVDQLDKVHTPSFTLLESDEKYFNQIPKDCLRVLKLLHHEKMHYSEIIAVTGWARGTIATRVHRARAIIRKARAADVPEEAMQAPTWGMMAGAK